MFKFDIVKEKFKKISERTNDDSRVVTSLCKCRNYRHFFFPVFDAYLHRRRRKNINDSLNQHRTTKSYDKTFTFLDWRKIKQRDVFLFYDKRRRCTTIFFFSNDLKGIQHFKSSIFSYYSDRVLCTPRKEKTSYKEKDFVQLK